MSSTTCPQARHVGSKALQVYPPYRRIGQTVSDNTWLVYPATGGITNDSINALNQYTAVGAATAKARRSTG